MREATTTVDLYFSNEKKAWVSETTPLGQVDKTGKITCPWDGQKTKYVARKVTTEDDGVVYSVHVLDNPWSNEYSQVGFVKDRYWGDPSGDSVEGKYQISLPLFGDVVKALWEYEVWERHSILGANRR